MTDIDTQTATRRPTADPADLVALVTGATSGIGREIARQLVAAGASVYVGARDAEKGRAVVEELGVGATLLVLDVTDPTSVAAAAGQVERLDVLVNNAGINPDGAFAPKMDMGDLRATYETNVFSVVSVTNAFLPALRRSDRARIVNVSSGTGSLTWSGGENPQFSGIGGLSAAYRSSKTALNALTLLYAQALDGAGVKVNALAPGLRATNLNPVAAEKGGDPAEAAAGAIRLATLRDDEPTGSFFSFDGTPVPW